MAIHESIACPHCNQTFALSEAISKDLEAVVKGQVEKDFKAKEEALKQKIQDSEKERQSLSLQFEAEKLALKKKTDSEKLELSKKLENEKAEIARQLELEKQQLRKKIQEEESRKAQEKYSLECQDLQNAVEEQKQKLKEANESQLKLRARQRELEQKEQQFELEMQKKLLEQEQILQENIRRQVDDEISLKMAAKDKVVEDMKREMATLQRRLEQGSQQLQGEVLELKIEELIRDRFPDDEVVEVKKGAKGADIEHKVMMSSGRVAGVIFAECKDVKEWSHQWPTKLKADMRDKAADLGVIISTALPKEIKNTGLVDGVWVCSPSYFPTLVTLLREQLIRVKRAELMAETPKEQKDFLFQYMTSNKFAHKVQGVCEMVVSMKGTLETEKRSIQKNWKKRETEIDQISLYVGEMYGELQGLVGKALPKVDALELDAPEILDAE